MCLLVGLVVDLRADWTPFTVPDGAESYGYGGAKAHCNPSVTRSLASLARTVPHAFVPMDAEVSVTDATCARKLYQIPISMGIFTTTFSVRSKHKRHASKLEMGALCLSVKTIVRQARWHKSRTFALVDAQALLYAERKGRSSAENLDIGREY